MGGFEDDTRLIRALVAYTGLTPAAISREIGTAKTTINRPYSGKATTRLSGPTLAKLKDRFPDFPGWTAEIEHRLPFRQIRSASGVVTIDEEELMAIPMATLDEAVAAGILEGGSLSRIHAFPRAFIELFTSAPSEQLVFIHRIGDGMEPTLSDRDLLLIDCSLKEVQTGDQIWLVGASGSGMVKRVRLEKGRARLMSDNPSIADYLVELDQLRLVGRVVGLAAGVYASN